WPLWSPDGRHIAYLRHGKDDKDGIYLHDAESGEAKRILKPESDDALYRPGSWLPDGSALLVWRNDPGHDQLVNLPFTGGEADASRLRPLLPSASHQTDPRLS